MLPGIPPVVAKQAKADGICGATQALMLIDVDVVSL